MIPLYTSLKINLLGSRVVGLGCGFKMMFVGVRAVFRRAFGFRAYVSKSMARNLKLRIELLWSPYTAPRGFRV